MPQCRVVRDPDDRGRRRPGLVDRHDDVDAFAERVGDSPAVVVDDRRRGLARRERPGEHADPLLGRPERHQWEPVARRTARVQPQRLDTTGHGEHPREPAARHGHRPDPHVDRRPVAVAVAVLPDRRRRVLHPQVAGPGHVAGRELREGLGRADVVAAGRNGSHLVDPIHLVRAGRGFSRDRGSGGDGRLARHGWNARQRCRRRHGESSGRRHRANWPSAGPTRTSPHPNRSSPPTPRARTVASATDMTASPTGRPDPGRREKFAQAKAQQRSSWTCVRRRALFTLESLRSGVKTGTFEDIHPWHHRAINHPPPVSRSGTGTPARTSHPWRAGRRRRSRTPRR